MAKILLVEDDAMILDMLSRRLRRDGHDVITATDGAQAVGLAKAELPTVIVMDIGLPILNGWQATNRIKTTPATSMIPVIALTAYAMPEDRLKCLAAGFDEYQTKPIDFALFMVKLQALINQSTAGESSTED